MRYVVIFDAASDPLRHGWFFAPGFLGIALGATMVFGAKWLTPLGFRGDERRSQLFGWFFLVFSLLWTVLSAGSVLGGNLSARQDLVSGHCTTVEGPVDDFVTSEKSERFSVRGVSFSYSDYIITRGFNNMANHGGPIREGLPVRICYNGCDILRLEVAR
jgi:hypothetical protein